MKQLLFILLTLSFANAFANAFATELPWSDSDFACVSQEQAKKFVSDFNVDVKSFGGMELCNPQMDSKKLFDDLTIIQGGQFSAKGTNLLIKGYVPADQYYRWMKSQTNGMERGNDVPYATAYNSGGYFTMQNGWALLSTLGRVGTVIHEARHTAGYRHMPCTYGPYAQSSVAGCDRDYAQAGSHSVEMEYYARVAVLGENFHPVYKAMARLMAMGRSNFVFNKSPIQAKEALVSINQIGQAELLDDSGFHSRETNGAHGQLKRTSFGAALFDGAQAFAIEMYAFFKAELPISDDYSYFKLLKEDRGQGVTKLKDFEEFDFGVRRYAVYLNEKDQVGGYQFPRGNFSTPLSTGQQLERFLTTSPTGEKGLFVVTSQGAILKMHPESFALTDTGLRMDAQISQITSLNAQTLALNTSGEVLIKNGTQWDKDPRYLNRSIQQLVSVPLYDAFEVK